MHKIEYIVWDHCDGYIMASQGEIKYKNAQSSECFPVVEITRSSVPLGLDFEEDFDGLFIVGNRIFRPA